MPSLKQDSFSGGLVSDKLLGKTSQQKYANGLRTCRNFWITRYGTAENRPGSQFIAEIKDPSQACRLLPFIFSQTLAYLLEVGNDYFRPYRDGARITATASAWLIGTTYDQGAFATRGGVTYRSLAAANTGNQPDVSPAWWQAETDGLVDVRTSVPQAAVLSFQSVQQNDVMTLADQSFTPAQWLRFSDEKWQTRQYPLIGYPGLPAGSLGLIYGGVNGVIAGHQKPGYGFDAVNEVRASGGNLALPPSQYRVMAQTGGNPSGWSFTATSPGGVDGSNSVTVTWDDYSGATSYDIFRFDIALGLYYQIDSAIAGATSYVDNNAAFTATALPDPTALQFAYVVTAVDGTTGTESAASYPGSCLAGSVPDATHPNAVRWLNVVGASEYRVYKWSTTVGVFGYIGTVFAPYFGDTNFTPDISIRPPSVIPLFTTSDDYPAVVSAYQQRILFANTVNQPQTVVASRVGDSTAFTVSAPIADNDAFQFTIASKQVQIVRHLIDLGRLIVHTLSAEYVCNGNQAGAVTPVTVGLVLQGSCGAAPVPPVVIGNTDLFVQARGGFVRDLRYEIQSTGYQGKDLTAYAPDLFANRTVVSSAWQQIPHSILWVALDDGTLLGCTYSREQDMWAWHEHDLTGSVEQVCVVPEAGEDVLYLVVKRTIDGATTRYIERLANRAFATIDDAIFCDSALSFDGRNTGATTMLLDSAFGQWTPQTTLILVASVATFFPTDVGRTMVFQEVTTEVTYDADGVRIPVGTVLDQVTLTLLSYRSAFEMTVQSDKDVPTWAQALALTTWGWAAKTFSGLDHLEGESVVGLGDGNVMPARTVTGGSITTDVPYLRLTVGLPIQADLQTLPIENTQGETIMNKKATVAELTANFYQTRGGNYGQDAEHLDEWVQRQEEAWSDPVDLFTGPVRIPVQGAWQTTAQLWIRQTDPLPIGISALVVSASIAN